MTQEEYFQKQINLLYNGIHNFADIFRPTFTPDQWEHLREWSRTFGEIYDALDTEFKNSQEKSE